MSTPGGRDLTEVLSDFLSLCARILLYVGGLAAGISGAVLIFTIFKMGDASAAAGTADALRNVGLMQPIFAIGLLAVGIGSTYLFWGEEAVSAVTLVLAAALFFLPLYLPLMTAGPDTNEAVRKAYAAVQDGGTVLGIISIFSLLTQVGIKARDRVKVGVKADSLKYGKGVKEETEKNNVFLGKCWQLPYCRKFVRERCPIYHSRRTCWREQTGCMCEEEVIKGAMENRPIPKDALLAAKMIPRNNRLTVDQKKERCRNCVIYNEHQRQKYQALLPAVLVFYVLLYLLMRTPLLEATKSMVFNVNRVIYGLSYGAAGTNQVPPVFVEGLLVVVFIVMLSYSLKVLEYAVFKLKL